MRVGLRLRRISLWSGPRCHLWEGLLSVELPTLSSGSLAPAVKLRIVPLIADPAVIKAKSAGAKYGIEPPLG